MKVLDLFSGIGGFSFGLHMAGMETVAFCECEQYPQHVLRKNFPGVPIYDDVRTLTAAKLRADGINTVNVITGGYPCQPFSLAGKRQGHADDRHLWPEMFRLITELRPDWVIGENVVGHLTMGIETVCTDLENAGYSVQPFIIPAAGVGAPHMRDRVWIVAANTERDGGRTDIAGWRSERGVAAGGSGEAVADASGQRQQQSKHEAEAIGIERHSRMGVEECGTGFDGPEQRSAVAHPQHGADSGHGTGSIRERQKTGLQLVISNTHSPGLQELNASGEPGTPGQHTRPSDQGRRAGTVISGLGGSLDELPSWLDVHRISPIAVGQRYRNKRLKALGNAVVPLIPYVIGKMIVKVEQLSGAQAQNHEREVL